MAGDILLYQTDRVPIGDDQRQHLELTRDIAERFNARFGETFVVPGIYPEIGARIIDIQEPTRKMSTTGGTEQGTIRLLDTPEAIRKKFRSAMTDSGREIRSVYDKPAIANLIESSRLRRSAPPKRSNRLTKARATAISSATSGSGRDLLDAGTARATSNCAPTKAELLRLLARRRGQGPRGLGPDTGGDVRADGFVRL